jgi:hypothetical protein
VNHRKRTVAVAVALIAGALAVPSQAPAFVKGFWGPTSVNGVSQFPIYRDLGVNLFQTNLSWAGAAPSRPANPRNPADPAYRWPERLDDTIREAQANGMRVLLLVSGTPGWANGGRSPNFAPRRPSDFANFVRAAAQRYPTVRHWMIWGEPTRMPNFLPFVAQRRLGRPLTARQKQAPHRYARLLDAAYGALKSVRRSNLVIGGNTYTTGDIRPVRWIQNLRLPNGRPPRMDLYGHNPFSFRTPRLSNPQSDLEIIDFSDIGRFSRQVDRNLGRPDRRRIPIFLSEFAVPTDRPDAEFNFHVTRAVQARWIRSGFRVARSLGSRVYGLGWIHLYDDPPDQAGQRPVVQSGLIDASGQKKPGYFAFKAG